MYVLFVHGFPEILYFYSKFTDANRQATHSRQQPI